MSQDIQLKKCGVRLRPPAIVITYLLKTSGKLHRRTMPVRDFSGVSGVKSTAKEVRNSAKHGKYLESMKLIQLEKLLTIIKDSINGITLNDSLEKNNQTTDELNEDLNKLDEEALNKKKALMDVKFEENRKQPGDTDFLYDVEVDFEKDGEVETCEWDDESDADF